MMQSNDPMIVIPQLPRYLGNILNHSMLVLLICKMGITPTAMLHRTVRIKGNNECRKALRTVKHTTLSKYCIIITPIKEHSDIHLNVVMTIITNFYCTLTMHQPFFKYFTWITPVNPHR